MKSKLRNISKRFRKSFAGFGRTRNDREAVKKMEAEGGSNGSREPSISPKKQRLAQRLSVPRKDVFQLLEELAWENLEYYRDHRKAAYSESFRNSCEETIRLGAQVEPLAHHFQQIAGRYDLDEKTPGNGYRSLVCVVDTTILHLVHLLRRMQEQRTWLVFRAQQVSKELEAFVGVLSFLGMSFGHVGNYLDDYPEKDLFPPPEKQEILKDLLYIVEEMDPSCFYGRAMGFQFCKSVNHVFQVIGMALATYSVNWERRSGWLGSLFSSGKLFLSPELRARRISHYIRHADVSFCKGFWNLSEGNLMQQVPEWFCPPMLVNEVQEIPTDAPLLVPSADASSPISIPPPHSHTGPRPIRFRILSNRLRQGMVAEKVKEGRFSKKERSSPSPNLLFHCHGGGFVATSSKSHETYLRHWAKHLDCTVISIDYSLAPQDPYPRAVEEVVYAYAWALLNPERLGWTGEKVCLTGDSAGGNLMAVLALQTLSLNFERPPDGLVLAYTPFFSDYLPSPSRLLSVMDPLLPPGIILRCLAAYTNNLDLLADSDRTPHGSSLNGKKSLQEYSEELEQQNKKSNGGRRKERTESGDKILSLINVRPPSSLPSTPSSSEEETFHTPSEETKPPLGGFEEADLAAAAELKRDAEKQTVREGEKQVKFSLETTESAGSAGSRLSWRQRSRSVSVDSELSAAGTSEGTEGCGLSGEEGEGEGGGATVEIHRDPSRIWLASSVCDSELVDYLSEHRLTRENLVILTANGETKEDAPPPIKKALTATPSVATLEDEEEERRKPKKKLSAAASIPRSSHTRSKSVGYLTKSISMSFQGTVAMATGHAYDHLSTLSSWLHKPDHHLDPTLEDPDPQEQEKKEENPLRRLRQMKVPSDMLLSPMFAPPAILARLPKTYLVAAHMDPLLDDTVSFAKKVRASGGSVEVDLLDGLPHGFLNFTLISPECREAAKVCLKRIRQVLPKPADA